METRSLYAEHRARPALLLLELLWRWGLGAVLLGLTGYEAWGIWAASAPLLRGTGVLTLLRTGLPAPLLQHSVPLLRECDAAADVLWPRVEHAVLEFAPLAALYWSLAYGWGRAAVLARWDPTLPRRPWLLAQSEAFRMFGSLAAAGTWIAIAKEGANLIARGVSTSRVSFEILLLGVAAVILVYSMHYRRAVFIAASLAILEGRSFLSTFPRAWQMDRCPAIQPLRRAVDRTRLTLALVGLVLFFVPAPFGLGWPLLLWWAAWSLPPLAAAEAWKLGAIFALIRVLKETGDAAAAGENS